VILYHITEYCAPPTHRSNVLIHQLALLCRDARRNILENERSVALWGAVLSGDYGAAGVGGSGTTTYSAGGGSRHKNTAGTTRRSCKRLKRSPVHRVRDAHKRMIDNTVFSFFYISELAHVSSGSSSRGGGKTKEGLTKRKLIGLLDQFGPNLRFNYPVSSGGTFLVEVCRARHVEESMILKCVKELVEHRGAMVDIPTQEAKNSHLTALCVAAVRGMPTVVQYLLQQGASRKELCSGRFRLATNARKSVRCTDATALEFATTMKQSELEQGATTSELVKLSKCIHSLSR